MIKYLEKEQKLEDALTNDDTVVVFSATWCGPCQLLAETLEEYLKTEKANIIKIDIDQHPEEAKNYGIMVVPTIMLFKNKEKIKQETGYLDTSELAKFINN